MPEACNTYKYGKRTHSFLGGVLFCFSFLYLWDVFNKTIIPLALTGPTLNKNEPTVLKW